MSGGNVKVLKTKDIINQLTGPTINYLLEYLPFSRRGLHQDTLINSNDFIQNGKNQFAKVGNIKSHLESTKIK
jgi:hypothetical protein